MAKSGPMMKLIAAHIDGRIYKISEYKGGLRSSFCFLIFYHYICEKILSNVSEDL